MTVYVSNKYIHEKSSAPATVKVLLLVILPVKQRPESSSGDIQNMAEAADSLPPAEVLLSKRVQEMVINQEEPPYLYICRKSGEAAGEEQEEGDVSSDPLSQIPLIDLSILSSSSSPSSEHDGELQKLRLALSSWGCFLV